MNFCAKKFLQFLFVFKTFYLTVNCYITPGNVTISSSFSDLLSESFMHIDGDVIVGALLPIREKKFGSSCKNFNENTLVLVDSLHYAIADVNSRSDFLTNFSLGLEIRDTCSEERVAHQALDFVRGSKLKTKNSTNEDQTKPVVGVISESLNKEIVTLLQMFNVPHIGFKEGSVLSSTKETVRFGTVSIGFYKALALVDLLKNFKSWHSVSVVYSNRLQEEFKIFDALADESNICLSLTSDLGKLGVNGTLKQLLTEPVSSVVLLFTMHVETIEIFTGELRKLGKN